MMMQIFLTPVITFFNNCIKNVRLLIFFGREKCDGGGNKTFKAFFVVKKLLIKRDKSEFYEILTDTIYLVLIQI